MGDNFLFRSPICKAGNSWVALRQYEKSRWGTEGQWMPHEPPPPRSPSGPQEQTMPRDRDFLSEFLLQMYSEWGRGAGSNYLEPEYNCTWAGCYGIDGMQISDWTQLGSNAASAVFQLHNPGQMQNLSGPSCVFCETRVSNICLADQWWDLKEIKYVHPHNMRSINVSFHPFLSLLNVLLFWLFFTSITGFGHT